MKKMFGGGIVAGILAAMLFLAGMSAVGAFGDDPNGHPVEETGVEPAALGPMISESNYVAITPCRVFDTRSAGGAFDNESRHFDARGNLAPQGGKSGGCGVPAYANAVVMTVTGVTPTGKGFMRGKAYTGTGSLPQATLLNYAPSIDASNTITLPIAQGLSKEFTLGTFGNRVHLVGDVAGYFVDPQYAIVDGDGTLIAGKRVVSSATAGGEGHYDIVLQGDVRGCAILATGGVSDDGDTGRHNSNVIIESTSFASGNTTVRVYLSREVDTGEQWPFIVSAQC